MSRNDSGLQESFGKLCLLYIGGGVLMWWALGTALPLAISLVALGFILVGYNALDKSFREQQS